MIFPNRSSHVFFLTVLVFFSPLFSLAVSSGSVNPVDIYKHFGEEEGLTTKTIYSMLQDKNGFIWFATDAGAFRYDGKNFKHFTVDNGITDNEILQIYEDKQGRIWFLTLNGYLSYWKNDKIYNSSNTPFLKKAYLGVSVVTAFEDIEGKLWLGCLKGGFIVIDDEKVSTVTFPPKERSITVMYIQEDLKKEKWIFRNNWMVEIAKRDSFYMKASIHLACHSKNKSELFYVSTNGIYNIYDRQITQITDSASTPYFLKIINMVSENGNVWLFTLGEGCYMYRDGKFIKRFMQSTTVTSVLRDREGNLWFSTMGEGVNLLYNNNNQTVLNYDHSTGLSESKIICVAHDAHKSIWLGYNNGMVDRISGNEKTTFSLNSLYDPTYLRVTNILTIRDTAWCGTDIGVFFITGNKATRVFFRSDRKDNVNFAVKQLFSDDKNNLYAPFALNLMSIRKDEKGFYAAEMLDSVTRTFSGLQTGENKFLVSGMTGIMEFSPGNYFRPLKSDVDLSKERILDMKLDRDKFLLIATNSNGLFVIDKNKLVQHISSANGLSDNNCRKLFLLKDTLYIASGNGLNILIKQNKQWILSSIITMKNGLQSNSVNDVSADDAKIYVATDKGLSIISRNAVTAPVYIARVIITEVLSDTSYNATNNYFAFNSDIPRLLIRFAYPVYKPQNAMHIKYRLTGLNKTNEDWIRSNNNEVEFSSLNPGSYKFQVTPDIDGYTAPVTTIYLDIKPLWWQTIIAKISLVFVSAGLVVFFIRRRIKKQYERSLAKLKQATLLESERNRIASDMHDDIGADLTKISIWSNILVSNPKADNQIVSKLGVLSRDVLQKMDQIIWALNSIHNKTDDLFSYIHSYASEYLETENISLHFSSSDGIADIQIGTIPRRNIFLVVKELLHNTVKHSKAKNVNLSVNYSEGKFHIQYADDGIGCKNEKGDGMGLFTIQKRMQEIHSSISVDTSPGKGFKALMVVNL